MALSFEEMKPEINTQLQHLQKLKNVTSEKTYTALCKIRNIFWEITNPRAFGIHLVDEGFGPLFLDLWNELSNFLTKERDSNGYRNLLALLGFSLTASDKCKEFGDEFVARGWASILLTVINEDKVAEDLLSLYILGSLFNCIRRSKNNRVAYRNANAITILQPLLKSTNVEIQTNSLIVLAYVVNEKEREILATSKSGLIQLLVVLRYGVDSEHHKAAIGGSLLSVFETLDAINQLAINDTSKVEIERQGAIPAIIRMLQDDFSDDEHRVAVEALWNLSFVESIRNSKILQSTVPALEKLCNSSNQEEVQRVCASALWQITGSKCENARSSTSAEKLSPVYQEATPKPGSTKSTSAKVMLSYQWDHQKCVLKIKERLEDAGYRVWMDISNIEGDILGAMANAVEDSDVILMCMSERYRDSKSCRAEASYAYKLEKKIIPLLLEPKYSPDGWLGLLQGMDLYYICYSDDELDRNMPSLLKVISDNTPRSGKDIADGPITQQTQPTSQIVPPTMPPSQPAAADWSAQEVQDWLLENNFKCPALEFYKGNGLEELYRQLTYDKISLKAELKSDYKMDGPTCNRFIAELRCLFK